MLTQLLLKDYVCMCVRAYVYVCFVISSLLNHLTIQSYKCYNVCVYLIETQNKVIKMYFIFGLQFLLHYGRS